MVYASPFRAVRKTAPPREEMAMTNATGSTARCFSRPHRHSIFCILPPHVLKSLAENGSADQRRRALETMATDQTIRALRAAMPAPVSRTPAGRRLLEAAEAQKERLIHDAKGRTVLPGTVVRSEGDNPTGDVAVDEAYDGLGATFDFFWDAYGRNSIDDEGMPLIATVHYDQDYNNAFWNSQQMVFGDGDGQLFNRFTIALDVIGHELAHGVTEDESGLVYFYQSGALNESMSDVFGSLIKQYTLRKTADQADWLIGAGLLGDAVDGEALRSMKKPGTAYDDPVLGKDPQPAHMRDYLNTTQDNGGVHINSGIPNHAFYQTAMLIGGYAWERAGRIWYEALRDPSLRPTTTFRRFAILTHMTAGRLYGAGGSEAAAVKEGWKRVGIRV
jgi:Zn-dependent metalloprotease